MSLEDEIKKAEEEEEQSYLHYMRMSHDAEGMGMHDMAGMMKDMAEDEHRHAEMMRGMPGLMRRMTGGEKSYQLAPEPVYQEGLYPHRAFPQTYMDWIGLAEDIKDRYPDDPVMRATVNFSLAQVAEETEEPIEAREERQKAAQEGKRWLTEKAGELGIK